MHYIGMAALHASAHMHHAPLYVAASVAIGIGASGLALWLAGGRGGRPPLLLSATALGIAIAGMHYTAMAGLTVVPFATPAAGAPVFSPGVLAIVVAVVAFVISAIFLLALVPDRASSAAQGVAAAIRPLVEAACEPPPQIVPFAARPAPATDGAPVSMDFAPAGAVVATEEPPRTLARQLPVERDGATQFLPVERIVAVHANAHYTYLFDGAARLFCPLAIGDVESRLDSDRFLRIHRSHIVNIDRITGLRRAGDSALVELAAAERYAVPVSRGRLAWLKSRLDLKVGAIAS
jgi:DNA-binding LytR/AlgR family response regulator